MSLELVITNPSIDVGVVDRLMMFEGGAQYGEPSESLRMCISNDLHAISSWVVVS